MAMSSLVDIWMSKVAKLRERRRAMAASRSEGEPGVDEEGQQQEEETQKQRGAPRRSTLSEATVCMLMDRFAPG